ncbi:MAG: pyridoxal-phosphate dependent enzyme [Pseudomonadota bacterium]
MSELENTPSGSAEESAVEMSLSKADQLAADLRPWLNETPTLGVSALAERSMPASIVAKFELWQRTGSFKARGALANVKQLGYDAMRYGVTAVSAGNHAIATAYAARELGTTAKVVMTASASPIRVARCEALGAEVVRAPTVHEAFAIAEDIADSESRAFIHPFEGITTALATAGVGAELIRAIPDLDVVIVPVGGGGLAAGVSAAVKWLAPQCRVFGVEPVGADSMSRSIQAGSPQALTSVDTIADSLGAPMALPISFDLCRRHLDGIAVVNDDAIKHAMRRMHSILGLAVEPACAASLAALETSLAGEVNGKRVGLIFCGSNIDATVWHQLVQ